MFHAHHKTNLWQIYRVIIEIIEAIHAQMPHISVVFFVVNPTIRKGIPLQLFEGGQKTTETDAQFTNRHCSKAFINVLFSFAFATKKK